jgi:hypothetical protein
MNIPDFIDWARSINPGVMLMFTEIYDGDRGIALKHLSKDILIKAKMQLQQYTSNDPGLNIQNAINQITFAIENNAENKEKALLETELFDKSRNQKFEDFLHPDITEWLKK